MTILTNFKQYTPDDPAKQQLQKEAGVIFLKSKENVDWYEAQALFDNDLLKVVFENKTGIILQTGQDTTSLWPVGCSIADVDYDINATPESLKGKVFQVRTGTIVDRKYTTVEIAAQAMQQLRMLQEEAARLIAPLQAGKELDMLTEEEAAYLINLQRYTVYLSRVPSQEGYPTNIEWPVLPTN